MFGLGTTLRAIHPSPKVNLLNSFAVPPVWHFDCDSTGTRESLWEACDEEKPFLDRGRHALRWSCFWLRARACVRRRRRRGLRTNGRATAVSSPTQPPANLYWHGDLFALCRQTFCQDRGHRSRLRARLHP